MNFAGAAEKKTGFGSNSFAPHCCPSKTAERVWVPGQDEEISCSPALTVSLSCVFTWCVASSCHCSPGHFGYVCMFSVTKDEITTETAYVLTLLLLLPNPLVEHKRPTDVPLQISVFLRVF